MKLATVLYQGVKRLGVVTEDETRMELLPPELSDLRALIESGEDPLGRIVAGASVPLSAVSLLAPLPTPLRNIICF